MRLVLLVAPLAAGLMTTSVHAQTYGERRYQAPSATLYESPDFRGRRTIVTGETPNLPFDFNDRARSGQFEGDWRICEDTNFGGRCVLVQGDVADLRSTGLSAQISSLEPDSGFDDRDDYRPGDRGDLERDDRGESTEGTVTVFFPHPQMSGSEVIATERAADAFCRSKGLGEAVWFDDSVRAPDGVDSDGQRRRNTAVVRDLVCRR